MKLKFVWILLLLSQGSVFSQATNKINRPLPTSFYDENQFKHDFSFKADIKNPQSKIVEYLENPHGTLVVNGNAELKKIKEVLDEPDKIIFQKSFVEIPYQTGAVKYRIPVTNISNHHSLSNPDVVSQLKSFITDCKIKKNEVPAFITLEHSNYISSCQFLSFSSVSNMYSMPYHQARLNLACVYIKTLKKELDYYVSK